MRVGAASIMDSTAPPSAEPTPSPVLLTSLQLSSTSLSQQSDTAQPFSNRTLELLRVARKIRLPTKWDDTKKASPDIPGEVQFIEHALNGVTCLYCVLQDGHNITEELGITWNLGDEKQAIFPLIMELRQTALTEWRNTAKDTTRTKTPAIYQDLDINKLWRTGWQLLWTILGKLTIQRQHPVEISAAELRTLIWPKCAQTKHGPYNWKPIIDGALGLLKDVSLYYRQDIYRLIKDWTYTPRGRGGHGNGTYTIRLPEFILGILTSFEVAPPSLSSTQSPQTTYYDFGKPLSPEKKAEMSGGKHGAAGDAYTRLDPRLPYYLSTTGFTPEEINLYLYLDKNITTNNDGTRSPTQDSHTNSLSPKAPRIYTRTFCEHLPANVDFVGALGHFSNNPERGFHLGTLAMKCYPIPLGQTDTQRKHWINKILESLERVVVKRFGGIVMGQRINRHHNHKWIPIPKKGNFKAFSSKLLWSEVGISCFLPANYKTTLRESWEHVVGPKAPEYDDEEIEQTRLAILQYIKEKGNTQKDLATFLKVTPSTVTYYLAHPDSKKRRIPIPLDQRKELQNLITGKLSLPPPTPKSPRRATRTAEKQSGMKIS